MKKIVGFTFLGLVIGIILGNIFTMAYYGHKIAKGMFMLQEVELIRNEDVAIQAYLNESPEIGIWALENYIDAINWFIKEREVENNKHLFLMISPKVTLKYAYVRLALLYEKIGNDLKRKENFEKAFEYCNSTNIKKELLEERLVQVVTKLDGEFKPLDEN